MCVCVCARVLCVWNLMNLHRLISSSPHHSNNHSLLKNPSHTRQRFHQQGTNCLKPNLQFRHCFTFPQPGLTLHHQSHHICRFKKKIFLTASLKDEASSKKGTIAGAVALIIGTSIGSGILALPQKTYPAVITLLIISNLIFF